MTLQLEGAGYGRVFQLTLELDLGLHVVLGNVSDGSLDLLQLSSGDVTPLRGRVRFDGEAPHRSPALRRAFGCAYPGPAFDEQLVKDAVARRLEIHACNVNPEAALSRLGTESLLPRTVQSLNSLELHAIHLAIALSLEAPKALFLCEPLACVTASNAHVVLDAIRQRADTSIVICATASPRTAALLAPRSLLLEDGRLRRSVLAATRPALTPGAPARVRVECAHAELMAEALTRDSAVSGLSWQRGDAFLIVEGAEVEALSRAILTLSVERQWWIDQLTQVLPDPVEIRATHAAMARAAYETTHHRLHADRGHP
ncbi:MAG TPA: hypothetical protein VI197_16140 [Polyangiaceae bacterium]